jgi:glutamine amidotransferase
LTKSVTIVDYGAGNLLSVRAALEYCGADCTMTNDPAAVAKAERILLPGVGAFGSAMENLRAKSLEEAIRQFAKSGRPLLGICLGMQMLLDESEEYGVHIGLRLIPGKVFAIPSTTTDGTPHRIPHVGWNGLRSYRPGAWSGTLLGDTAEDACVYFVHSFTAVPTDPLYRLAYCDYGGHVISAVIARENVMGCQFHPEKSGEVGLGVLRNFLKL